MEIYKTIYGGAPLNAEVPTYSADRYFNDPSYLDFCHDYVLNVGE